MLENTRAQRCHFAFYRRHVLDGDWNAVQQPGFVPPVNCRVCGRSLRKSIFTVDRGEGIVARIDLCDAMKARFDSLASAEFSGAGQPCQFA